jgi:hypothetical protein
MDDTSLEETILFALRCSPGSRSKALAEAVGLPRTNFGRRGHSYQLASLGTGQPSASWLSSYTPEDRERSRRRGAGDEMIFSSANTTCPGAAFTL